MTVANPPYLIRDDDRRLFKQCRRAWDLGSTMRSNHEPRRPVRAFDFDRAMHEAMAIYYFPGMWHWNRAIVYPLVREAFAKAMREQRDAYLREYELSPAEATSWDRHMALGDRMLENYFTWAPDVDRFTPAWVAAEFDVGIPDPDEPGRELVTPDGRRVLYRDRIEALVQDDENGYWLMDHRIVRDGWADPHELLVDERCLAHAWAWELDFIGWRVAGVIYNELRAAVPDEPAGARAPLSTSSRPPAGDPPRHRGRRVPGRAGAGSGPWFATEGNSFFNRTRIRRGRDALDGTGRQIALEVREMTDPGIRVYPSPTPEHCSGCAFREPCAAMFRGADGAAELAASFRERGEDTYEAWRLGSRRMGFSRGALPPGSNWP